MLTKVKETGAWDFITLFFHEKALDSPREIILIFATILWRNSKIHSAPIIGSKWELFAYPTVECEHFPQWDMLSAYQASER